MEGGLVVTLFLALGIVPSLFQLLGFAIVLAGFRLTQKG